jgi:hypothetical protein
MLFSDIKMYFVEVEIDNQADEEYIKEIEDSRSIEELISIVSDFNNQDEFEASYTILTSICR